ncbi:MAG: hypothetical protein H0T62_01825 [Parachlamydiaceae bacterium]|nr:hypothetical protein [Parachlamydiaceae bacterium]
MSSVTNFIAEVDVWAWHQAEKLAENSPTLARVTLVIPIAIGTIVRDLLANPAKCVEELIRLPFENGVFETTGHLCGFIVSPITALIDAIGSVAFFLWDPYGYSRCSS